MQLLLISKYTIFIFWLVFFVLHFPVEQLVEVNPRELEALPQVLAELELAPTTEEVANPKTAN